MAANTLFRLQDMNGVRAIYEYDDDAKMASFLKEMYGGDVDFASSEDLEQIVDELNDWEDDECSGCRWYLHGSIAELITKV